jgi:hypothetical protein
MALLRGIGRAAPLLAAGVAAGWYLRRQGLLGGAARPELPWPPDPAPSPPASPPSAATRVAEVVEPPPEEPAVEEPPPEQVAAGELEPEPEEPEEPLDAHAEAVEAVSDAADVTAVVEDLLAVAPGEEQEIVDAEVVEESEDLNGRVRMALAEIPGLLSGAVQVESSGGIVWLRGELARPEAIGEAERRAAAVGGVVEVRNLLHLPGTPPPTR